MWMNPFLDLMWLTLAPRRAYIFPFDDTGFTFDDMPIWVTVFARARSLTGFAEVVSGRAATSGRCWNRSDWTPTC